MHNRLTRCTRIVSGLAVIMLAIGLCSVPAQAQSNDEQVEAAKEATQEWLALVDAGDYEASWEQAAGLLKSQITAKQWAERIQQVKSQLGAPGERALIAARYTTSLPNVPEGEYVVVQYRAQYGGQNVVETATLTNDEGTWRVAGYFVRPAEQ